jgi:hypothetical protein
VLDDLGRDLWEGGDEVGARDVLGARGQSIRVTVASSEHETTCSGQPPKRVGDDSIDGPGHGRSVRESPPQRRAWDDAFEPEQVRSRSLADALDRLLRRRRCMTRRRAVRNVLAIVNAIICTSTSRAPYRGWV